MNRKLFQGCFLSCSHRKHSELPIRPSHGALPVVLMTSLAMLAFASNSLLCRLALAQGSVDAASFSALRIASGAAMLGLIAYLRHAAPTTGEKGDWRSAAMLFIYMVFFSFAYIRLEAGTGALILFAAVQLMMFTMALRRGEHFSAISWGGLALAVAGLIYLVSPGLTAPDPLGAMLMAISGLAWGLYSLFGQQVRNPLNMSAWNFVYLLPAAGLLVLLFWNDLNSTFEGRALAMASGALASGAGYVVWYSVLPKLTAMRAATVQLSVPAITAFGGALLLAEPLTLRLVLASLATLGGVAIVLTQRAAKIPQ